ncbi:MAG TPA: hypothetical protein DCM28_23675, partial [Phycisphaerales bacterium]|nr:hypothetical protein [Phycisphaerales bacterium]
RSQTTTKRSSDNAVIRAQFQCGSLASCLINGSLIGILADHVRPRSSDATQTIRVYARLK